MSARCSVIAVVVGLGIGIGVAHAERPADPVDDLPAPETSWFVRVFAPGPGQIVHCVLAASTLPPEACSAPAPRPPPPPGKVVIAAHTAFDPSTLTSAAVAAKVTSTYLGDSLRCYRALLQRTRVRGTIKVDFAVNAVGRTEAIAAAGFDAPLAACVAGSARRWQFPIPTSSYAEPRTARFSLSLAFAP